LYANGNPILNVFQSKLVEIFSSRYGDNMQDYNRLISFIELETVINADYRPICELESVDKVNTAIVITPNDIDKACKVLGSLRDLPPEKMRFYEDVFYPLVEKKKHSNLGVLGEIEITSSELTE